LERLWSHVDCYDSSIGEQQDSTVNQIDVKAVNSSLQRLDHRAF
jgi:hypothetical protein